jgi:F420-non-reducing hydrogenase iron-sulfur subunit
VVATNSLSTEENALDPKVQKILVFATITCAYPGADTVGQSHTDYPSNIYVLRVPAPVLFPDDFYLRCFEKGAGAIIVMACGAECPYVGAFETLAARIDRLYGKMKERGLDPRRIRLTAICTVCSAAFLREVNQMNDLLARLGPTGYPAEPAEVA